MPGSRPVFALIVACALTACSASDPATRNQSLDTGVSLTAPGPRLVASRYTVTSVDIRVARNLKVSEANVFYPLADIVWHGDPPGDRHDQVAGILADGIASGTINMQSGPRVRVEVELTRFHALTEKTRYTVGGVHSIHFDLTVRDAESGAIIDGPRRVVADVKGSGGAEAIAEDAAGRTQRVVIVERINQVIQRELTRDPGPGIAATSADPAPRLPS